MSTAVQKKSPRSPSRPLNRDPGVSARLAAVQVLQQVIQHRRSLADALPNYRASVDTRDQSLVQELCFGTLRWQFPLRYGLNQLLSKPLASLPHPIQHLLLLGLYQLLYTRIPTYAVVASAVDTSRALGADWATKLVNAVLRNGYRQRESLLKRIAQRPQLASAHPRWLWQQLQKDWPEHWSAIIEGNNQRPPLTLRVNLSRVSRADYLQQLRNVEIEAHRDAHTDTAITLATPCPVERLPGFTDGLVSVQDSAAQFAAGLLDLRSGQRVLDACAAPGGKAGHMLERQSDLDLWAVDSSAQRLVQLRDNLQRLKLSAKIIHGDAADSVTWWDGRAFDHILVDAPCSATGVIRRHPDIKLLRRASDIAVLARQQLRLLGALWPTLKPGGQLLYITCSVLARENDAVIEAFRHQVDELQIAPIETEWGIAQRYGRQNLPGTGDGFYYALLRKPD